MARLLLFFYFLSLALVSGVNCRGLSSGSDKNTILISDGVHENSHYEFDISLDQPFNISENACVHVYEFLPCADNFEGYLFQVFSFGCLLIIGEFFLTEGKAKLFDIFEVGFYGGIVFPLLTMFPRIALMLSTGLSGSREFANSMVGNNVGVTVGYTVFALTMQWGSCIVFGLDWTFKGKTNDSSFVRFSSLAKHLAKASVAADPKNQNAVGIMLMTLTLFIMVTVSEIFDSIYWRHFMVLITLVVSASATIFYFFYSYFDIADQEKSLDYARFELKAEDPKHLESFSSKSDIQDGQITKESIKSLSNIDVNKDGKIEISNIRDLTVEYGKMSKVKCDPNELAIILLTEFDRDSDGLVTEDEFKEGFSVWLKEHKAANFDNESQIENTEEEVQILKIGQGKEKHFAKFFSKRTLMTASIEVILGILIVIFLAKPFMMNVELLSVSVGVPSFYVVFVFIPLARNLKNALSAHFCRKKDKDRITSDTFSDIYRDVTMNNLMGISIILAIVYCRGLEWDYSLEVLIVVIVGLIIGVPAYVRKTYPFWICVLAFSLYIFSLVLIYVHFKPLEKN